MPPERRPASPSPPHLPGDPRTRRLLYRRHLLHARPSRQTFRTPFAFQQQRRFSRPSSLEGAWFRFLLCRAGAATGTVIAGQTAYFSLAVKSLAGASLATLPLGGPFTFQCSGLPANALCAFNPVQLPGLPANVTGMVNAGLTTAAPKTLAQPVSLPLSTALSLRCVAFPLCAALPPPSSRARPPAFLSRFLRGSDQLCLGRRRRAGSINAPVVRPFQALTPCPSPQPRQASRISCL